MNDDSFMDIDKLSVDELLVMFGRSLDETRWIGFADSAEYLSVVTYVAKRKQRES